MSEQTGRKQGKAEELGILRVDNSLGLGLSGGQGGFPPGG